MNNLDARLQKQLRLRIANILLCSLAGLALTAASASPSDGTGPTDSIAQGHDTSAASSGKGSLNSAQQAEIQSRIDLANAIAQNVSEDARSKGANESWRMALLSDLYKLPSESLRNIANSATSLKEVRALTSNATGRNTTTNNATPKSLGSATDSLVFTPITPCRFIDTRNGGSPISGSPTTYNVANTGATYGGAVGCAVPSTAPALAANVTVVVGSGLAGYLVLRPTGSTQLTSFINWPTGGTPGLANAGIVSLAPVNSGGTRQT
jgi:hypothetical protein